ncbi:hypothetical protein [Teredinibacter haidensis]|uniref:hypothetical protein n=1 Tax=Teredinibacter haidensis TaxID=2731755 RepID=UPI000948E992|nr:hypothetical protein [Teredinibacter haidensis]
MREIEFSIPDFTGKCVSFTTISGEDKSNIDIFNPVFENQAGRIFVKGISPKGSTESGWVEGCEVALAWDQVSDYFVFANNEEFQRAAEASRLFYESDEGE